MRAFSYFNSALKIISFYKGEIPLHHFLKIFFSKEKKYGSKDRKFIAQLCYSFYRTGFAFAGLPGEEKLRVSLFLGENKNEIWVDLFPESWKENFTKSIDEKIGFIQKEYPSFLIEDIFPFKNELSETIDSIAFARSFLIQPKVFVRIRNNTDDILQKLKFADIFFEKLSDSCLAFENNTKLDTILAIDKEVVIQDFSSQKIRELISLVNLEKDKITVWDCCAASGGKSILVNDILKNIELTVSDIRPSILKNLLYRFSNAGILNFTSFVADLSSATFLLPAKYDLIICDVPCSGSGTWSRTPEELFFFKKEMIEEYAFKQQKIISKVTQNINKNGYFLYITCSVFYKENNNAINFIQKNSSLQLIQKNTFKGYECKADTMFAALFVNK